MHTPHGTLARGSLVTLLALLLAVLLLLALLLLVALFSVAPAVQPPITVGVTETNCTTVTFQIKAPEGTQANAYGPDLGSQPPWQHHSSIDPVELTVVRDVGTRIEWGIGLHGGSTPIITGVYVVPPCISAPDVPVEIGDAVTIEAPVAPPIVVRKHRGDVFERWTQRIRGAW